MRQQALHQGRFDVGQRLRAVAAEGQVDRDHQLRLPAGRARIALVAGRAEGAHQVLAAAEHQQLRLAIDVGGHPHAGRNPQRIGAADHVVVGVQQQHVGALRRVAVGGEDGVHLLLEVEAQAQHAGRRAAVGMQHAVRVHQRTRFAGPQVGGAEGFVVAVLLQRLLQQRVAAVGHRRLRSACTSTRPSLSSSRISS
jgi:hypothetical protein